MAYETGSATDWDDFISKLTAFVTTHGGWTDETAGDSGTPAADTQCYSKNNVVVALSWASTPNNIAMYQSLGYVDGAEPNAYTDDSGNGTTSPHNDSYIETYGRHISDVGDGPFLSYHFFENDASPAYVHIVLQIAAGIYRHFGFGELDKFGDWDSASGGEYVYGHKQSTALSKTGSTLLDGGLADANPSQVGKFGATMHMEDWVNQPVGGKWAVVWGCTLAVDEQGDIGDDTAAVGRIGVVGGHRANFAAPAFGWQSGGTTSGLIPMYPMMCMYYDWNTKFAYVLGWHKDVRGVNIENFAGGDSVSIDGDTWVMFPSVQKGSTGAQKTYNQGIAYKKVTA